MSQWSMRSTTKNSKSEMSNIMWDELKQNIGKIMWDGESITVSNLPNINRDFMSTPSFKILSQKMEQQTWILRHEAK